MNPLAQAILIRLRGHGDPGAKLAQIQEICVRELGAPARECTLVGQDASGGEVFLSREQINGISALLDHGLTLEQVGDFLASDEVAQAAANKRPPEDTRSIAARAADDHPGTSPQFTGQVHVEAPPATYVPDEPVVQTELDGMGAE